jgi:hypothetical protein
MTDRRRACALLLLALPLLAARVAPAARQEQATAAPDFSAVTTKAAAQRLVRKGELVEILYFPAEFGGPDEPQNIGYITPEAAQIREMAIGTFGRFAEDGTIDTLKVVPDYKGGSVVPSSITMTGTRSGEGGSIGITIDVW